jgi:neutral ceramidase
MVAGLPPRLPIRFLSRGIVWLAALWLATGLAGTADGKPRPFRAGAATSNITPPLGGSINGSMRDREATHIHDELHARCLVLDDGSTRLAIVVGDACLIPRHVHGEAKHLIQETTGIPVANVLISATHTHSAPTSAPVFQSEPDPAYPPFLARRIADGVRRAVNNLAPALIGWGVGSEPTQVNNRRWKLQPGTPMPNPFGGTDQVKMNPPPASPTLVGPAGPIDPEVAIVAVRTPEGRPLALLANYSLHYVGGTGPGHISADYFGAFADRVQQLLGADRQDPPFVAMMSNGTSGDINNTDFRNARPRLEPYEKIRLVADALAQEARRVYQRMEFHDWVPLGAARQEISLGVRKPAPGEVARAKEIMARARSFPRMDTLEEIYARETVQMNDYPDTVPVVLQSLRVGDLAINAIPCEVFVEIGLELKRKSPFKQTFTISLANGYNGYLPTPEHHALGGYETWRAKSSYLETGASPKIIETLLGLLDRLRQPGSPPASGGSAAAR